MLTGAKQVIRKLAPVVPRASFRLSEVGTGNKMGRVGTTSRPTRPARRRGVDPARHNTAKFPDDQEKPRGSQAPPTKSIGRITSRLASLPRHLMAAIGS